MPAKIFLDERFMINLGLSVGDGLNNPGMKNGHYNFVNTNYDLIALNFNWLKEDFRLKEEKIEVYATGSLNCDKKEEKRKLAEALQIKEEKIRFYKRERNKKVGVGIQVSNRIFQELYLQLFPKLKNRILEKGTYRRAFLKGLFAAEGHIKHSIYETIESISFSYNPKTEIKLSRFVRLCLRKEGINAKMEKRGGMIYFCSYEQMVKFYLLGISNLHREKKEKFERLLKKANVSLHLNKDYKAEKREISQLQLSKRWNVCQPTISHYENRKKIGLDLARRVLPERKWRGSIDHIQISNSKIRDKRCIKFIINHLKQV
ncbi:MAG: LAGLIDADG family homing endonuclease [Candidatus Nanoarchaeia archaeon]